LSAGTWISPKASDSVRVEAILLVDANVRRARMAPVPDCSCDVRKEGRVTEERALQLLGATLRRREG
jgi:hypothetical protein